MTNIGDGAPIISDYIDTIGHLLGHNRLRQLDYGRRPDETRLPPRRRGRNARRCPRRGSEGDVKLPSAVSWQLLPSTAYVRRTPATSVDLNPVRLRGRQAPSSSPSPPSERVDLRMGRGQWSVRSECRACAMRAHAPCAPSLRLLMPAVERLWGHGYLPCHEPDPRSGGADLCADRNG